MAESTTYNDLIFQLAIPLVKMFRQDPNAFLFFIKENDSPTSIGESLYNILVNHEELVSFKKMNQVDKDRIWSMVSDSKKSTNQKIKICKTIHAIESVSARL